MRGALARRLVAVEHSRLLQWDPFPKAARDAVCAARMVGITPDEIEQVWAEALAALSDDELDQAYTASLAGRATEALVRRTFEALARRTPEDHDMARAEALSSPVPTGLMREEYAACINAAFDGTYGDPVAAGCCRLPSVGCQPTAAGRI